MQKHNVNEFVPNCYNNDGDKMVNAILPASRRNYSTPLQSQGINLSAGSASSSVSSGYGSGNDVRSGSFPSECCGSNVFYQNAVIAATDVGICMGMSNCHLTESSNDGFNSLMSTDYSILQQYHPQALSQIVPSPANGYKNNYTLNQEQIEEVCYLSRFNYVTNSHLDKYICMDGRQTENSYQRSNCNKLLTNIFKSNNYEMDFDEDPASPRTSYNHRITTSIKYQDKNRKLDFKANFLEENKKINGCFHEHVHVNGCKISNCMGNRSPLPPSVDTETDTITKSQFASSADITADVASTAPPKKKWIRHYLKGEYLLM